MNETDRQEAIPATHPADSRLPCRGCLPCCVNYPICDGRPWRLPNEEAHPGGAADT